ncbi:hypothetical protein ACO2Q3_06535 [Caulobacter sp. KR2-114]|uniref:hypothetical protein n=1 Tax=Caulobacter sp. KR2-114 TaxID=3400912 RepID=UPI003C11503C
MTVWSQDLAALQRSAPTPLLTHLAGEHAARIAGLWSSPHTDFISAPADRRHLTCFVLSQPGERLDRTGARALLEEPMRILIRELGEAAPPGLARALARLGEVAWTAEDYRHLAVGLRTFGVSARLRHAEAITPASLATLRLLPAELRDAGLAGHTLTPAQAATLIEVHAALAARDGPEAALAQARLWSAASSVRDLLQRATSSLDPPTKAPPFPGSADLRPLASAAALVEAASRYNNCLASYLYQASTGDSAFYEWTAEPGAVVQIARDPLFGWRLEQARGPRNQAVPPADRDAIAAVLRGWGVHVGRSHWELRNALEEADNDRFELQALATSIDELFGA